MGHHDVKLIQSQRLKTSKWKAMSLLQYYLSGHEIDNDNYVVSDLISDSSQMLDYG